MAQGENFPARGKMDARWNGLEHVCVPIPAGGGTVKWKAPGACSVWTVEAYSITTAPPNGAIEVVATRGHDGAEVFACDLASTPAFDHAVPNYAAKDLQDNEELTFTPSHQEISGWIVMGLYFKSDAMPHA